MTKNPAIKTAVAFVKEYKSFTGLVTIIVVSLIVAFAAECKAHADEVRPAVAAKKAKVIKTEKPSTAKRASKPVITIIYEGAKKPVSFDRDGNATYHAEMIPVMKAVVLPSEDELMDVTMATRHEPVAKDGESFTIAVTIN